MSKKTEPKDLNLIWALYIKIRAPWLKARISNRYPGFCQPFQAVITITLGGLLGRERGPRVDRFGLAPCGVCRAAFIAKRAVRSYRTISPLPLRAVCFLLYFPSSGVIWPRRPAFSSGALALWSPEVPPPNRNWPGAVIWVAQNIVAKLIKTRRTNPFARGLAFFLF